MQAKPLIPLHVWTAVAVTNAKAQTNAFSVDDRGFNTRSLEVVVAGEPFEVVTFIDTAGDDPGEFAFSMDNYFPASSSLEVVRITYMAALSSLPG